MGELYENSGDRARQSKAAKLLQDFLQELPVGRVQVMETPEARRLSHDLDIYVGGMYVGVVEVKCRSNTADWFRHNGWAFEVERLTRLKSVFYREQAKQWSKNVSLMLLTSDNHGFIISIERVIELWPKLQQASDAFGTDDHGSKPNGRPGIIIPLEEMTCVT